MWACLYWQKRSLEKKRESVLQKKGLLIVLCKKQVKCVLEKQECIPVGCVPLLIDRIPRMPPQATTHTPSQSNHTCLPGSNHACPQSNHTCPPRSNHACPPRGATMHAARSNHAHPPRATMQAPREQPRTPPSNDTCPPMDRMWTHAFWNIPCPNFVVGGNNRQRNRSRVIVKIRLITIVKCCLCVCVRVSRAADYMRTTDLIKVYSSSIQVFWFSSSSFFTIDSEICLYARCFDTSHCPHDIFWLRLVNSPKLQENNLITENLNEVHWHILFSQSFEELAKCSQNMPCGQCEVSKCLLYSIFWNQLSRN